MNTTRESGKRGRPFTGRPWAGQGQVAPRRAWGDGKMRRCSLLTYTLWHGLLTVPPNLTEGLPAPHGRKQFRRPSVALWHGQETVPQRDRATTPGIPGHLSPLYLISFFAVTSRFCVRQV